jgi:predicted nucleic acid-binding protein
MIVVADAGPLIYLSEVGLLHLLRDLYGVVIVPREVYQEVVVRGEGQPGAAEVAACGWIQVSDGSQTNPLRAGLMAELDAGESAAITLALERSADLVLLDERKGRRVARRLGLLVRGTLGILVEAKKRGHVPLVAPLLERLVRAGSYLSPAVEEEIRRSAGE